ncbi:MAG: UDP-N-acetylmuramoyl-tripeptide--D-alanyl-D-alanine ligase [Verrucomicrobiaceae bacterium]
MKHYTLQTLADAMGGTLHGQGGGELVVTGGVSTDTRSIGEGALFFALRGENFDAHDFLDKAGAAIALVVDRAEMVPVGREAIVVKDTLSGLQRLAYWYRRELGIRVVAITGSNGKTSTKDLTKAVLGQKFRVNATLGNFNNHIGLPLTVLATEEEHEVGIFEMGMNHSGELAPLCEIARPDISIITNVGTAHIENMGSREAIAEEKGAVARALGSNGTLLIPADCEFIEQYRGRTQGKIVIVGNGRGSVRAENLETGISGSTFDLVIDGVGRVRAAIPVAGKHMVSNALLAAGTGHVLGMTLEEIAAGLAAAELTGGRLRQFDKDGVLVIDDTYNANPESITAGLETLAALPLNGGVRHAVLGIMAEQGDHAAAAYRKIGKLAADLGLHLVIVGQEASTMDEAAREAGGSSNFFKEAAEAASFLQSTAAPGDAILFKGSRAAAMERVMNIAFPQN